MTYESDKPSLEPDFPSGDVEDYICSLEEGLRECQKDEEIKRLTDLNKAKSALIKAQAKKIGMLLKEKEWLLEQYCKMKWPDGWICEWETEEGYKKRAENHLQQALKED